LDSGWIHQATVGHKNTTPHLVHFIRQQRRRVKMDARSSLVVFEPELVGSRARAPAGAESAPRPPLWKSALLIALSISSTVISCCSGALISRITVSLRISRSSRDLIERP
jgi:hypothetical protein